MKDSRYRVIGRIFQYSVKQGGPSLDSAGSQRCTDQCRSCLGILGGYHRSGEASRYGLSRLFSKARRGSLCSSHLKPLEDGTCICRWLPRKMKSTGCSPAISISWRWKSTFNLMTVDMGFDYNSDELAETAQRIYRNSRIPSARRA